MRYRIKLRAEPPAHSVSIDEKGIIVVEWYDLSPGRLYDSASMLMFDEAGQRELGRVLGLPPSTGAEALVDGLGQRFGSYFEIREFAEAEKVPYEHEVDFDL